MKAFTLNIKRLFLVVAFLCTTFYSFAQCGSIITTWDGSGWDNMIPNDLNDTAVIINGNYSTGIRGNIRACTLTINTGFRLTVDNDTFVEIENDVNVDGQIYVETKGAFVQNNDLSSFNVAPGGTTLVNKSTTPLITWNDYTFWSSPVEDETVGNALSFSNERYWFKAANYSDILTEIANTNTFVSGSDDIDDNGDDWQIANAMDLMTSGIGFAATHSSIGFISGIQYTYIFNGAFNNGEITTPIAFNGANGDNDWNFIGNPYPCALDAFSFFTANSSIIGGAAYLWSHNTAANSNTSGNEGENYAQTDYAIITSSGVNIAGGDKLIPLDYIPSGQGFFVQGLGNGDVTFNNSMRMADISSNGQFFRSATIQDHRNVIWMNLSSDNGVFNQMAVAFIEGATDGNDGMGYDAVKNLSSGNSAMIYSLIQGEDRKYAVQGKHPDSLVIDEVVGLGFNNNIEEDTQFTLSINQIEGGFMNGNTIYLRDNLLDIFHDLSASDYIFSSEVGEFNNRFEIRFSNTLSTYDVGLESDELIISNERDNYLGISTNKGSKISNIKIFDLLGRELYNINGYDDTRIEFDIRPLSNSIFIINATLANRKKLTKKFLNQ